MVHLLNLSVFSQSLKHMAKKKKYTIRKFINDVHLWLGLGSGIILFLVFLSGTFLTFEEEITLELSFKTTIVPDSIFFT